MGKTDGNQPTVAIVIFGFIAMLAIVAVITVIAAVTMAVTPAVTVAAFIGQRRCG
ncbi:hypothetical protein D3C77_684690 [compost metagenome]